MSIRIIIIFLLLMISVNSAVIELNQSDSKISLLEQSSIYIDENSTLTFQEIQTKPFQKYNSDYLHLGMTKATAWIKFSLKNNSTEPIDRYITLNNPLHDTVELYIKQKDGRYSKQIQGMIHVELYEKNNLLYPTFKVHFNVAETKEFYYKAHSLSSANFFKLFLKDTTELYKDEFSYQLVEALFFGAMFALILYNIFIFIFTRELSYFYYIVFISITTINYASYSAMLYYIIQDQTLLNIDAYLGLYYLSIANIFALLFIDKILHIERYKYLHKINLGLIYGSILLMVVSIIKEDLFELSMYYLLICMFYILLLILFAFYKKTSSAKYILAGWIVSINGIFALALHQYGIFNPINVFPYFYETSTFLEAILFSVALAAKLNKTTELENSLKRNVLLTKELHHRIKNNMQFIILMYRLKLANQTNEKIDEKLKEIESAIQAISKTHEILYNQKNLDIIDTKLYFENLVLELQHSFTNKNIEIKMDINTILDTQQTIYCGIILNELITNAIKYAFKEDIGIISITLCKKENKHLFVINDNGIGFNYETKQNDSFGLVFIKAIVESELKGNISFESINGTSIKIQF